MMYPMYECGNLIGAEWVAGEGEAFSTLIPAKPERTAGRYTAASAAQVDQAVRAFFSTEHAVYIKA